ncbi:hypothetical protein SJZ69_15510 [Acinetobacter baumannii]|nr:hypothetical protein [Acinetobacter baumannii]
MIYFKENNHFFNEEKINSYELVHIYPISPSEHSMGAKVFMRYVRSKFTGKQLSLLSIAITNNFEIECHGLLHSEINSFLLVNKYKVLSEYIYRRVKYNKICNSIKPVWILVETDEKKKKIIIFSIPGIEHLQQYASLLTTAIIFLINYGRGVESYRKSVDFLENSRFYFYKNKQEEYTATIGLDHFFKVNSLHRDTFVISDITLETLRKKVAGFKINEYHLSEFSIIDVLAKDEKNKITFIMIKPSFWGSLAGQIAKTCMENNNVSNIVYIAKLGAINKNINTFDIVNPNNFYLCESIMKNIDTLAPSISNKLLEKYNIKSTTHVSVPTVMEETTIKINYFSSMQIDTIDNEISYIAKAISKQNSLYECHVKFSCLHMVTDIPSSNIMGSLEDLVIDNNHLLSKTSFNYRKKKEIFHNTTIEILFDNFGII